MSEQLFNDLSEMSEMSEILEMLELSRTKFFFVGIARFVRAVQKIEFLPKFELVRQFEIVSDETISRVFLDKMCLF